MEDYTDIVSLPQLKEELRQMDNEDFNDLHNRHLISAVSYISEQTGLPLIDTETDIELCLPIGDDPLWLPEYDVKEIISIQYWPTGTGFGEAPVEKFDNFGRLTKAQKGSWLYVKDSWPDDMNTQRLAIIKVKLGLSEVPAALQQAVVAIAREFFDGVKVIGRNNAALKLLQPFKRVMG